MQVLFNFSFVDPKTGLRTLVGPAQGRYMIGTPELAEERLKTFRENNGRERIESIFGAGTWDTFRVDQFECYDHGDPVGIYVEE